MDKSKVVFVLGVLVIVATGLCFSQPAKTNPTTAQERSISTGKQKAEENTTTIKGEIKEIAKDKTYIIVEDTKILTTKEFVDEGYLEVGDKVEITAEKTKDGLKAISYNYIFEEESEEEPILEETEQ
ncbi:MAG: hypothetical protein NC925_04070 [Candidatus Omnitrophica bacterium]|nr:hypothetical protein [Candidatus Omnitrophota bacterium]MCM8831865.1 hypothetical protein [Candidatus Omnitrophota bacterium]